VVYLVSSSNIDDKEHAIHKMPNDGVIETPLVNAIVHIHSKFWTTDNPKTVDRSVIVFHVEIRDWVWLSLGPRVARVRPTVTRWCLYTHHAQVFCSFTLTRENRFDIIIGCRPTLFSFISF